MANLRALAAKCCFHVVDKGRSLADELPAAIEKIDIKDKGLLQELCYGVLRYLPSLEFDTRQYISKPLKGKQRAAHFLMLVGIYQLKYTRIPDHAAVAETVAACKPLKQFHLKSLVNAVLRNYQRGIKSGDHPSADNEAVIYNHPGWFIKKIQAAYPEKWQSILEANLAKPPMWLRVNQQHNTGAQYQAKLSETNIDIEKVDSRSGAILLNKACDVYSLPGFELGHVSIQDAAAQQSGVLLEAQDGDRVLDCCAAPGGKTCHILESANSIDMTAIDVDENRLARVQENLDRIGLSANLISADATKNDWWDGQAYDRILLDAPCSAMGVIRRHPDSKWLRKADDIAKLAELQKLILKNTWSMLKPGGTLLYATCSILPEENDQQISQFLDENQNAKLVKINATDTLGWQILPDENNMDGFYYAKIIKQ